MSLDRSRLPDPIAYFDEQGVRLTGPGKWGTGPCLEHGGSDSFRVNRASGGHVCMSCGVKGGDVIADYMRRHGVEFVDACKALGAWIDDGKLGAARRAPLPFSARAGLEVVAFESMLVAVAACNIAKGIELASADRDRLVAAASRIRFIAEEVAK